MSWSQVYDPLGNAWLSTLVAALPILAVSVLWRDAWAARGSPDLVGHVMAQVCVWPFTLPVVH